MPKVRKERMAEIVVVMATSSVLERERPVVVVTVLESSVLISWLLCTAIYQ